MRNDQEAMANSVLLWGILGAVCSFLPYLNFIGIILSVIGLVKKSKYEKQGLILEGKANAGRILLIVGLIIGIVLSLVYSAIGTVMIMLLKSLRNP